MRSRSEAGAISECEWHEGCYYQGQEPAESAYKLANSKFTRSDSSMFDGRREMTDFIQRAIDDNSGLDECAICQKNREED